MNTTSQIQTVNEANTSGTLLTKDGCLTHFVKPPSIIVSLNPGDEVTCRCICVEMATTVAIAVIVSVP